MRNLLVDSGPLIALFDKDDKYHLQIRGFLQKTSAQLVTTWPVITEVSHMLDFDIRAQLDFLRWIHDGGIVIYNIELKSLDRIIQLTEKYRDCPMDLADATLAVTAESLKIKEIISIDIDFDIYRTVNKKYIKNVFLKNK